MFHTGTPSAGITFDAHARAGAERGLRHVAYSRPGYGHSERSPGFVPFGHGECLARKVPGARPDLMPGHGQLSVAISSYGEILDDLPASAG